MVLADALSRLKPIEEPALDFDMTIHTIHYSSGKLEEIRNQTNSDETLKQLLNIVTEGWPDDPKRTAQRDQKLLVLS